MARNAWQNQAPRSDGRTALSVVLGALVVALATSLVWSWVTRPVTQFDVVNPPPHTLDVAQRAGLETLLGKFASLPTRRTGTVTIGGETKVDIDLSVLPGGTDGAGTLVAGRVSGQVTSVNRNLYLRGSREFWTALGALNVAPDLWVHVPADFLSERVFLSSGVIVSKMSLPGATMVGDVVTSGDSSVTLNTDNGVSKISVPGYDVSVSAPAGRPSAFVDGPDPEKTPLLLRDGGAWRLNADILPPPDAGDADKDGEKGEKGEKGGG